MKVIILVLVCLATQVRAGEIYNNDSEFMYLDALIEKYGKSLVIDLIRSKRNGSITLDVDGLKNTSGRPNPDYVNARSIYADLNKVGWDVLKLKAELDENQYLKYSPNVQLTTYRTEPKRTKRFPSSHSKIRTPSKPTRKAVKKPTRPIKQKRAELKTSESKCCHKCDRCRSVTFYRDPSGWHCDNCYVRPTKPKSKTFRSTSR